VERQRSATRGPGRLGDGGPQASQPCPALGNRGPLHGHASLRLIAYPRVSVHALTRSAAGGDSNLRTRGARTPRAPPGRDPPAGHNLGVSVRPGGERTPLCRGGANLVGSTSRGASAAPSGPVDRGLMYHLVPTLRVGMPPATLCVANAGRITIPCIRPPPRDAERPGLHSHAERGNEGSSAWERGMPQVRNLALLIRNP
jgi:hypothetical protein